MLHDCLKAVLQLLDDKRFQRFSLCRTKILSSLPTVSLWFTQIEIDLSEIQSKTGTVILVIVVVELINEKKNLTSSMTQGLSMSPI